MIRKSGYRFSLATNAKRLRGDHAQTKKIERDDDSKKSHPALARLLDLANRRKRPHGDAGRRHIVVGHEEIRHQGHGSIDAVVLEGAHAAGVEHLVVNAKLPE